MESPGLRTIIEIIEKAYPGRISLTAKEVATLIGRDVRTAKKRYQIPKVNGRYDISVYELAKRSIKNDS